jgi:(E)-4-hydroxy-3-methyl-but-2-enyl pyrophosphate reductase
MEIVLVRPLGYCHGVQRSLRLAEDALEAERDDRHGAGTEVCALGALIHNSQEIQRLREDGLKIVDSLDEVASGTVLIRAHGVPPSIFADAAARGLNAVDATCRIVRDVQEAAIQLRQAGCRVVIYGHRDHPEIVGVLGAVNNDAEVVDSPAEAERLPPPHDRLGLICQTTKSEEHAFQVLAALERLATPHPVLFKNTLCRSVIRREQDTRRVAEHVDVMVIVGGKNSSNTRTLALRSEECGARAYHVETAAELQPEWFAASERVGITAGVSTPVRLVVEVRQWLEALACASSS